MKYKTPSEFEREFENKTSYMTDSNHFLRKLNPGMSLEPQLQFGIDLKNSWMVGDRMSDVEAGHRARTRTVLIGGKEPPNLSEFAPPEFHVHNLKEVAEVITGR